MTIAELENAKEALRKTIEGQKALMPIDKEDVAFFVSPPFRCISMSSAERQMMFVPFS